MWKDNLSGERKDLPQSFFLIAKLVGLTLKTKFYESWEYWVCIGFISLQWCTY